MAPVLLISVHDGAIRYLNTDLDLTSDADLTALAAALEARGVFALHVTRADEGHWHAGFETVEQHPEPEANIAAMLTVLESLEPERLDDWACCTRREFNIGYECGQRPWAFNQALTADLLDRIGTAGVSLRITLYPNCPP